METTHSKDIKLSCYNLLSKNGYKILKYFDTGGSEALTLLATSPINKKVIVKISFWDGIGGNGIPWLISQCQRLKYFEKTLPEKTSQYFPKVYENKGSIKEGFFFYTLEYFPNATSFSVKELLRLNIDVNDAISNVISFYSENIYPLNSFTNPNSNYTDLIHLDRMKYRTTLLTTNTGDIFDKCIRPYPFKIGKLFFENISEFFQKIKHKKTLTINGQEYTNLFALQDLFYDNKDYLNKLLKVEILPTYYHGDLLLRNVLISKQSEFKYIDVRGLSIHSKTPSKISIAFEMGKIAHSFFTDLVRDDLFTIEIEEKDNDFDFYFSFKKNELCLKNIDIWENFIPSLKTHESLKIAASHEKNLDLSVEFAQAVHFAADAINRMSQDPSGKHTLAYYLISILIFSRFLKKSNLVKSSRSLSFISS